MMNPPSGTNIHPKDWMLVQRTEIRMRCLELAREAQPTMPDKVLLGIAEQYYKWVRNAPDDGGTG
jgi:hypothetical protein